MKELAAPPFNHTIIFFDQLGSGNSTHLPENLGDYTFWTEDLFLSQVEAVLQFLSVQDDYDLLGHTWGGMLASVHAAKGPSGLNRLVLANTPVSGQHWLTAYRGFREEMAEPYRGILEIERTVESSLDPEYLEVMDKFNKLHFINVDPVPKCLQESYKALTEDRTVTLST